MKNRSKWIALVLAIAHLEGMCSCGEGNGGVSLPAETHAGDHANTLEGICTKRRGRRNFRRFLFQKIDFLW